MDSFLFNKAAGAILGTLLFGMGTGIISDAIFVHAKPAKPGYDLPTEEVAAAEPGPGSGTPPGGEPSSRGEPRDLTGPAESFEGIAPAWQLDSSPSCLPRASMNGC